MIKLSVVIPAYNVQKFIKKCLQSCITQDLDLEKYEIIVIDDGSTDSTSAVIQSFIDNNSNVNFKFFSTENRGQSAARNFGMQYVSGEYVWFIDADDYIDCSSFSKIIGELESGLDMVWFDHVLVDERNEILQKPVMDVKDSLSTESMSGVDFLSSVFRQSCMICMFAFRTQFLRNNGLRFYEGVYLEDMLFIPIAIHKAKKIKYFNSILYFYLIRNNSTMRDSSKLEKRIWDSILIVEKLNNYRKKDVKDSSKKYFDNLICKTLMFNIRRSVKDCSAEFSFKIYKKVNDLDLLPIKYIGDFKSQILALVLNTNFFIYKKICKILP